MRSPGVLLVLAFLALGPVPPAQSAAGGAGESGSGLDYVTERIICDCGCSNLTVRNCTCGKADRVRAEVAGRLAHGETPEQVLQAYVDEYGEQILAAPTREGFNLVGWWLPLGAVVMGGAALVLILRRWAKVPPSTIMRQNRARSSAVPKSPAWPATPPRARAWPSWTSPRRKRPRVAGVVGATRLRQARGGLKPVWVMPSGS